MAQLAGRARLVAEAALDRGRGVVEVGGLLPFIPGDLLKLAAAALALPGAWVLLRRGEVR